MRINVQVWRNSPRSTQTFPLASASNWRTNAAGTSGSDISHRCVHAGVLSRCAECSVRDRPSTIWKKIYNSFRWVQLERCKSFSLNRRQGLAAILNFRQGHCLVIHVYDVSYWLIERLVQYLCETCSADLNKWVCSHAARSACQSATSLRDQIRYVKKNFWWV